MINTFILDCSDTGLFKDFIQNPNLQIKGAVILSKEEKQYCLEHQILETHTYEEIDCLQNYLEHLSFPLIDRFRATQRKIEFGMMRHLNSNMLITNKYYNALAYFHWFFQNFAIDCIFIDRLPHGHVLETIIFDMGRELGIPTYCIFPVTSQYSSLIEYNRMQNIPIADPVDSALFSKQIFNKNKTSYDAIQLNVAIRGGALKKMIHKGGGQLMIDILSCIKKRNFTNMGRYKNMRLIEKLYSYYRLKEMRRFYEKNSIQMDTKQNYIFYAIHFEPEAATGVVTDLQNQLTIIQLLSQALPENWLLYIKDHPHQYNINNALDHYYLTNIQFFKDISFYQEVLKLQNVRLIDLKTPSEKLIEHSCATATINGSIILESLLCQKSCITFDRKIMAITQQNFDLIHSFEDLKTLRNFIASLQQKQPTQITQEELQNLARYYFDHHSKEKAKNIIQSLLNHLSLSKKSEQVPCRI